MLIRRLSFLLLLLSLSSVCAQAQVAPEPLTLVPGQLVEREIAGGKSHEYQTKLKAGQFLRIVVEQKAIDATLVLTSPDGKQVAEANLTEAGGQESLSTEAAAGGVYRLTVSAAGMATLASSYQLRLEVKKTPTAQDRQRIAAEALMITSTEMERQGGKNAGQAIEKMEQALSAWRSLNDPYWAAWTLSSLGVASSRLSRYEKAIGYLEQALAIRREVKDRDGEGRTLNLLGDVYFRLSRQEKAIEYLEQALAIHRASKNRTGEAVTLAMQALAYDSLGRYEKQIEYFGQALEIFREVKNRADEGRTLYNLGSAYISLGRYEKAIEHYGQALAIHRELKNRSSEGIVLHGFGGVYGSLGRNDKAIEYFEQALAIYRELKNRDGEGHALYSLGWAYGRLNRPDKAIEYHEQALAINREVKSRFNEGNALYSLGNAYRNLGRYEKAIEYFEQALAIAREIKARGQEIDPLVNLGSVYRSQAQYEKATKFHEQALAIAREVKQKNSEAWVLHQMMLDWKARNQPPLAVFFGKQSVNAYQEIRGNLSSLDRESQQSYLKSKETTYRQLADLLIGQGRLPEAEQVIRILKEEEYFDFVRRDSDDMSKGGKTQLTPEEITLDKRYREILDKLAELGTERGTLIDKKSRTPEEDLRLAKLDTDLVVAGNEFQKFLDGLTAALGTSGDASVKVFQLRESQGLMEDLRELGQGVVAVYTLIGEDKYRFILTTPDFQKGYEYPIKGADLNRKVLEFREVLQNPRLDPRPLSQELYQIMLGPVAKDLAKAKVHTIMWSLDGVLRYVPVAALNDGQQYLVEQYQNVVFTPASQARLKDAPSRNWDALGLGVSKAHGERIPALPGVLDEMRGIIREESANPSEVAGKPTGVLPGVVKLDEQFTQQAMLSELRKRHKVVHIASHFQFSPGNETNSALLLGDGSFLSLAQIKSLPNVFGGVELLTLSACNTATGGAGANGKEVEGFGVLAQRQGAQAVIASLWPVFDSSTKVLM
ncbi:hypothetical protein BH20ACI3_BH20ACI3_32440 [soil metagenome]